MSDFTGARRATRGIIQPRTPGAKARRKLVAAARRAREAGRSFDSVVLEFGIAIADAADLAMERHHDWLYQHRAVSE